MLAKLHYNDDNSNNMLFQAMLVPMTENLLGWDELANSIFFCVAGVEVFLECSD